VSAFVHDQVGAVDEKKSAVGGKSVGHERYIKDQPRHQRWAGNGLPGLAWNQVVEKRLKHFEHGGA
jgi:hypothetical protein